MDTAQTVQRLLMDAPGEALCDKCLAVACARTLTEMRHTTNVLLGQDVSFQRGSTCASCRRAGPTIVYWSKCAHCSLLLDAGDPGFLIGGELFHVACLRRLITDDTIRLSRALNRRSRELIEQSRRRIRHGSWPDLEPQ